MINDSTIDEILDFSKFNLSRIKPSEWGEANRYLSSDISPIPGKLNYNKSPYTREIVDCLSSDCDAQIISVKKGQQIGFSTTVIETGIGWIISQAPGNIMFNVGHDDLVEEAITKVDKMLEASNIKHLIRSSVTRVRNAKTGDTNKRKEFPGGYLVCGVPNHKLYRNRSIQYGFIDDFEAAKGSTKQAGATTEMIEGRFAAYAKKMKLFYISTPELKEGSNIEPVYLLGDQRKFFVPCPCCGELINFEWSVKSEKYENEMAGITWKLDENNDLIRESVGYICQKCGDFFNDKNKDELLIAGEWKPTAKPSRPGYRSYHISSLYAPTYMYDWEVYVRKFLIANPPGQPRQENIHKTFVNLCLGECYEAEAEDVNVNDLQKNNIRNYTVGLLPEKLSEKDGNGKIILVTCAADLNGKVEDARLDYEIIAHTESGSTYSIDQGSIGTFIPNESGKKNKVDREHWSYEHNKFNSVWPVFENLLGQTFKTDTGRELSILVTGIDTGHCEKEAFEYIDKSNRWVIGVKGEKEAQYVKYGIVVPNFKKSRDRAKNLYLLQVNQLKDQLSRLIRLKWDEGNDQSQPEGYMNYPQPTDGKYSYKNFFSHYESEHRVVETKDGEGIASMWKKKDPTSQNHFWDCRIYNNAIKEILVSKVFEELKIKEYNWQMYVDLVLKK